MTHKCLSSFIVLGYKAVHTQQINKGWSVWGYISPMLIMVGLSSGQCILLLFLYRCCPQTQKWSCVTTLRCCGSIWAYLETDWGKSTGSRTPITSTIFTTRKRSHQGGSRTSCLSGPTPMRENWCVWMDGRTDEWVLKSEWVNEEMGEVERRHGQHVGVRAHTCFVLNCLVWMWINVRSADAQLINNSHKLY